MRAHHNQSSDRFQRVLVCLALALAGFHARPGAAAIRFEDFAGAEACARCHQKQYELWKESTHARAGGRPNEVQIIARFDGQPLRFQDAAVTPTRTAQGELLFRVAKDGAPAFDIPVDYVIGGGHMAGGGTQSFFSRRPDGTVRFLPFDFIRGENLWFVQVRADMSWAPISRELALETDLANWPPHRVLGTVTESSNCQNCHGSQITAGWDSASRQFTTRFQSLTINCESCHGPARRHLELVSSAGFQTNADLGLQPLATLSKDASVKVCLQCHATKEVLREDPYLPGMSLDDYFSLKLPLLGENPYHVDGRIRSFSYQGNHLFSDCYRSGSMTCVDCHEPHRQTYRDVFLRSLPGRLDNGQCTGCHASKTRAEHHSHHKPGSPGNACVDCHMPYLQQPAVGHRLHFARSDHSIPIPRPEFDHQLGIENACQKCHADQDLAWQERHAQEWWGTLKPHPTTVSNLLRSVSVTDPIEAAALLLTPQTNQLIGETAALATWLQRFLRPGLTNDARLLLPLLAFARRDDPDLRSLAFMALQAGFRQHTNVRDFLADQEQGRPPASLSTAIRLRWSTAADTLASRHATDGDLPLAIYFLGQSIDANPENFVSMSHLALAHLQSGDGNRAVLWLRNAIKASPNKAVLHFQLAQTLAQLGRVPEAIDALESGLRLAPEDPAARRLLEQLRAR